MNPTETALDPVALGFTPEGEAPAATPAAGAAPKFTAVPAVPAAPGSVTTPAQPGLVVPLPVGSPRTALQAVLAFLGGLTKHVIVGATTVVVVFLLLVGARLYRNDQAQHLQRLQAMIAENQTLTSDLAFERAQPWYKVMFTRSWW